MMLKKEAKQIKEMKLEIERLKKLPDYEYVILDIQEEIKRAELLQFIKTVGAPHIWSTYNFYLKEIGCEELIPDGSEDHD